MAERYHPIGLHEEKEKYKKEQQWEHLKYELVSGLLLVLVWLFGAVAFLAFMNAGAMCFLAMFREMGVVPADIIFPLGLSMFCTILSYGLYLVR